jgi:hypothetical protein
MKVCVHDFAVATYDVRVQLAKYLGVISELVPKHELFAMSLTYK